MSKSKTINKFAQIAKEATLLSPIMQGRTKKDVDELLGEEITITGVDFLTMTDKSGESKEFVVCTYEEEPECFFFGGTVLTKIAKAWVADYASPEECSEALAAEGGCVVKMTQGKTKNGNKITNVEII